MCSCTHHRTRHFCYSEFHVFKIHTHSSKSITCICVLRWGQTFFSAHSPSGQTSIPCQPQRSGYAWYLLHPHQLQKKRNTTIWTRVNAKLSEAHYSCKGLAPYLSKHNTERKQWTHPMDTSAGPGARCRSRHSTEMQPQVSNRTKFGAYTRAGNWSQKWWPPPSELLLRQPAANNSTFFKRGALERLTDCPAELSTSRRGGQQEV